MLVTRAMAEEAADLLAFPSPEAVVDADHVSEHYRTAAKGCHPDRGGSAEAFARVDRAKHVLLAWLAKRGSAAPAAQAKRPCERCEGRGYVITGVRPGSAGLRRSCVKCSGSGDADLDLS